MTTTMKGNAHDQIHDVRRMTAEMNYGDVALGVEAALPAMLPNRRPNFGYARLRRTLSWLCAALKRWA